LFWLTKLSNSVYDLFVNVPNAWDIIS